jgi:hypothetical protein
MADDCTQTRMQDRLAAGCDGDEIHGCGPFLLREKGIYFRNDCCCRGVFSPFAGQFDRRANLAVNAVQRADFFPEQVNAERPSKPPGVDWAENVVHYENWEDAAAEAAGEILGNASQLHSKNLCIKENQALRKGKLRGCGDANHLFL